MTGTQSGLPETGRARRKQTCPFPGCRSQVDHSHPGPGPDVIFAPALRFVKTDCVLGICGNCDACKAESR